MLLLLHALAAAVETPELATASSPEIRRAQLVRVPLARYRIVVNRVIRYKMRTLSMLDQTPEMYENTQYMTAMYFLISANHQSTFHVAASALHWLWGTGVTEHAHDGRDGGPLWGCSGQSNALFCQKNDVMQNSACVYKILVVQHVRNFNSNT